MAVVGHLRGHAPGAIFDVKVFERPDGKHAAVVRVDELPVPPCVTASGVVYQRVPGLTKPVTDQSVLAELVDRGRRARDNAEALSLRASQRALAEPGALAEQDAQVAIALCPVRGANDPSGLLFSKGFVTRFVGLVQQQLRADPQLMYSFGYSVQQDCVRAWPPSRELGSAWTATAYWDGAVSAAFSTTSAELYISEFVARVRDAWAVLVQAATALGGSGTAHLAVAVRHDHPAIALRRVRPTHPVQRWTELRAPQDEEVGAVERELLRSFGEDAWEPEG